jgi:hypothetical protein
VAKTSKGRHSQSTDAQVLSRIYGHRRGWVFTPADAVARASAKRDAVRLQPAGAYAAIVLGLSEQVSTRIVLLTDGPPRRVKLGRREIVLKRTPPRNMATAGRKSGTVIQALRNVGRCHAEVVVKESLLDARLVRDLPHARTIRAALDEDGVGRLENPGLHILDGLAGWFDHSVNDAPMSRLNVRRQTRAWPTCHGPARCGPVTGGTTGLEKCNTLMPRGACGTVTRPT